MNPHSQPPTDLRMPAHHIGAEQAILGSLLLDPKSFDAIADVISESDFYRDDHRRIFRAIATLCQANKACDVVSVADHFIRSNEVDQTGGMGYLIELANNVASSARIRQHAEIVKEHRLTRDLQAASYEIVNIAFDNGVKSSERRIDDAQSVLLAIADARPNQRDPLRISELLAEAVDDLQARYESDKRISGLTTGFADLDQKLCGLQPGDLIILAARPSMGKTALALNIAEHVAVDQRLPTLVFSVEMSGKQLANRSMSSVGGVQMERIRDGNLSNDDWDRLTVALGKLSDAPLYIDQSSAPTVAQMRARATRIKRKDGLALIVIDYLQLMSTGNTFHNRNEDLSEITRGLKMLAKDLGVPVILLSQLSRKCEERTDKRPLMSDLRESGAIEQDADVIVMIYRDEQYNPESQWKGIAELIIRKQRMGPTGEVRLSFAGHFSRFADLDPMTAHEIASRPIATVRSRKRRNPSGED